MSDPQVGRGLRAAVGIAIIISSLAAPAAGENWPQWRGPFFNGSTTETNLPATFAPTENVLWTADLLGVGGATPIIHGDRVFVSAMEPESKKLWAACYGASDGKLLWKHEMGTGFVNAMGNMASAPSPIADGKHAWFYYGTGELACFEPDGKPIWRRSIPADHGKFEILWNYASTGLLFEGKLYIQVLHGDIRIKVRQISYLLCVDPLTGKDIWKAPRASDAEAESRQAFSTPFPLQTPAGWQVLVLGGDYLTGHSPTDGKELWRSPSYNRTKNGWWRTVPSPVGAGDVAIACAPKGGPMLAVRTADSPDVKAGEQLWSSRDFSPDVCTPLIYQGKLLILTGQRKEFACMDLRTGAVQWKGQMPGKANFQASPTAADGKIYCIDMNGEVVVLAAAADKFEVLHQASFGGSACRATIAVANGRLFIRTDSKLYCIGKP